MDTEITVAAIAAIPVIATGWLTFRASTKGAKDSRDMSWFDRLSARVDALEEKNAELSAEIEEVKLDRFHLRVVVAAFVQHVHLWRSATPKERWPPASPEVAEKMGDLTTPGADL